MRNPIDAFVEFVNPHRGLERRHARQLIKILDSGYSEGGASKSKNAFKDWRWRGGSTKEDIDANLDILRQRSRDLGMNSPIASAALDRIQTNVVGVGLQLRALPDYEALAITREEAARWGRHVEREWRLWAQSRDCDQLGLSTFDELQQIALISWLASGDVFALLPMEPLPWQPYDLRIHLVEADRVCNPSRAPQGVDIRQGVELSKIGRVVAYWVKAGHPLGTGASSDIKDWRRIEVRGPRTGRFNILHMMNAKRPDQYRGVPLLAPVIESCKQLSRYSEAELMAAVIASLYTVFIKSETPDTPFAEAFSDEKKPTVGDPEDAYSYSLGPGAIVGLGENEDITIANPGRPNAQFDAFINAVSTEIGAAINVPSELLLLRFTSSYSASRAALLEAWKSFRMWRAWLAADFCQPIYTEWLWEAVLRGRISAPGFTESLADRAAWCRAEWHGPAPGQVDPMKEVQAAKIRVEEGFSTRARETAELTGGDYEANVQQLSDEENQRREAGLSDSNPIPSAPVGGETA